MTVNFRNKEQSNQVQEKEFLNLSPIERIYSYLNIMVRLKDFPTKNAPESKDNFVIEIKTSYH